MLKVRKLYKKLKTELRNDKDLILLKLELRNFTKEEKNY